MKRQKENFLENIRWSELGKQNIQAKKVIGNRNSFSSYPYKESDGRGERALIRGEHFLLFWPGGGCMLIPGRVCTY